MDQNENMQDASNISETSAPRRRRSAIYHQEENASATAATPVQKPAVQVNIPAQTNPTQNQPVENAPAFQKRGNVPQQSNTPVQGNAPAFAKKEPVMPQQTRKVEPTKVDATKPDVTRAMPPIRNIQPQSVPTPGVPKPDGKTNSLPNLRQPQNVVRRPVNLEGMQDVKSPAQRQEEARQRSNLNVKQMDMKQHREHLQEEMQVENLPDMPEEGEKKGKMTILAVVICILLVIGVLVVGLLMIPDDNTGALGQLKQSVMSPINNLLGKNEPKQEVPTASGFTATLNNTTAPYQITFNLVTSSNVTAVRVADAEGNPLEVVTRLQIPNADDTIVWLFELTMEEDFSGIVEAQVFCGDAWVSTGLKQTLTLSSEVPASISNVPSGFFTAATNNPAEPDDEELTADSHEEPTVSVAIEENPTETPTNEPTTEPTQEPTETPTAEPEATATEVPVAQVQVTLAPTEVPTPTPTAPPTQAPETTDAPVVDADEETENLDDVNEDEQSGEDTEVATEEPVEEPTEAPTATPRPVLEFVADASADPSLIANTVVYEGDSRTATAEYERTGKQINMPASDEYMTKAFGVLTYRGNAFRQNAAVGTVEDASQLSLVWTVEGGSIKAKSRTYYGFGWTNQPLIVQWPGNVRKDMDLTDGKAEKTALKEVIAAGLDGKIYFLDLEDGSQTREVINLGYPIRSTPAVTTFGYPQMVVGQYARFLANKTGNIGLHFYELLDGTENLTIDGLDGGSKKIRAYNDVGAFDTSALYDRNSDTFITAGTNGMLYTIHMNTVYEQGDETHESKLTINPEITLMKSRTKNQKDANTAVEASIAMYGGYAFYADVQGVLRCVDVNTMTTIWAVETGDAVKASIALDQDADGQLWLYTANTLLNRSKGDVTIRRYNAQTGAEDWALAVNATKKSSSTAGAMASPVVGQHELNDLVYFTLSNLSASGSEKLMGSGTKAQSGVLVALNKNTGKVVWTKSLGEYCYSSPVAVYNENGKGWIIQATNDGLLMLLDGLTGETINTLQLNGTIESSPAVYRNMLVICTTGKNTSFIYGVKID